LSRRTGEKKLLDVL
jgi:hypothetical protein